MENMEKKFSQAEVDEIVANRLGREKGKQQKEATEDNPLEQEETPTVEEKTTPNVEEKTTPATQKEEENPEQEPQSLAREEESETQPVSQDTSEQQSNQLLTKYAQAELKAAMAVQGVDPAKLDRASRLVGAEEILENGEVNVERMHEIISELLQSWPELQRQQSKDQKVKFGLGQAGSETGANSALSEIFGNR